MALPPQMPLQMPRCFTMTIKKLQVSPKSQKPCSSTHPIDIHHPGCLHFSLLFQHLELISFRLYKEVEQLTFSCRFQGSSRALSLIILSSSSFRFCSSSSFTFHSCHFFSMHSRA